MIFLSFLAWTILRQLRRNGGSKQYLRGKGEVGQRGEKLWGLLGELGGLGEQRVEILWTRVCNQSLFVSEVFKLQNTNGEGGCRKVVVVGH